LPETAPLQETTPLPTTAPLPETAPLEPPPLTAQMPPTTGITEFDFQHFTEKSTLSQTDTPAPKDSIVTFEEQPKKKGSFAWSAIKFILVVLLLLLVAAGAFYAGMKYKERSTPNNPAPQGTAGQ
jgi:hypothetical protein